MVLCLYTTARKEEIRRTGKRTSNRSLCSTCKRLRSFAESQPEQSATRFIRQDNFCGSSSTGMVGFFRLTELLLKGCGNAPFFHLEKRRARPIADANVADRLQKIAARRVCRAAIFFPNLCHNSPLQAANCVPVLADFYYALGLSRERTLRLQPGLIMRVTMPIMRVIIPLWRSR